MSRDVVLKGLTWDHPRACDGLFAETERFNAGGSGVSIRWEAHSLRGFEATPIAETAARYDLIILDHPFMGDAAVGGNLVDLAAHLGDETTGALASDYVGRSFDSYAYEGGLWALPIDAASQVAVCRPDLFGGGFPRSFDDVTEVGRAGGLGLSLANPHAFMAYLGIAASLGCDISGTGDRLIPVDAAIRALEVLRSWAALVPEEAFDWSSIGLLEAMATTDRVAYCPSVFSFNSYAQPPAAGRHILRYGDMPGEGGSGPARAVLGGTGLAVSALSDHIPTAVAATLHFVGRDAQTRMAAWGGQPAHRDVWMPDAAPTLNGDFFDTCRAMQTGACLRPRWPGYIALQNAAGRLLCDDLARQDRPASQVVGEIEEAFRSARASGSASA